MNRNSDDSFRPRGTVRFPDTHIGELPIAHSREEAYESWRAIGPLIWADNLLGSGGWLVLSFDACRNILAKSSSLSRNLFSVNTGVDSIRAVPSALNWHKSNMCRDDELHPQLNAFFKTVIDNLPIANLPQAIHRCCDKILQHVYDHSEFDLVHDISWPLVSVFGEFLGIEPGDMWRFSAWEAERIGSRFLIPLPVASLNTVNENSTYDQLDFMKRMIDIRRRHPKDDLLTAAVKEKDMGCSLTEDELVVNLLLFFISNSITLRDRISGMFLELLRHRTESEILSKSFSLHISQASDELLRVSAPDQLLLRTAIEDLEICRTLIRKNDLIIAVLGAANRDNTVFPDPHRLSFHRHNSASHLAYFADTHAFLGERIIQIVMRIAIERLIKEVTQCQLQVASWSDAFSTRGLRSALISTA